MIKKILIVFIVSGSINVMACSFSSPKLINIGISTKDQKYFSYTSSFADENIPYSVVNDCSDTADKREFVMLSFGYEMIGISDLYRTVSYNKDFREQSSCFLKNNPIKKMTSFDERKDYFENKWNFIDNCIDVNVTEMGSLPLVYPTDQQGCVVTPISTMSAKFSGGFCFFKPNINSQYKITLSIAEKCLTINGYKESEIDLQDLNAELNAYTSQTYKDNLKNLVQIGRTDVRVSVNPDESVLKPNDDFGILIPTFPINYQINDLHLGKILLRDQGSNVIDINVPFVVDNASCEKNNFNGVKSSTCDYAIPFIGDITLKDYRGKEILSWQDGGVASASWQGILNGQGFPIDKELLPVNQQYTLEVEFSDPKFAFNTFKKRFKNRFGHIASLPLFSNDGGEIAEINGLGGISGIDNMAEVGGISGLSFGDSHMNFTEIRRQLAKYFSSSLFPPDYEKVCNSDGKCVDASKTFAKFTASFKLLPDYSISNLEITRKSNLLNSYTQLVTQAPEYICQ